MVLGFVMVLGFEMQQRFENVLEFVLKASTWFYYDLVHSDWRLLNGIKRHNN